MVVNFKTTILNKELNQRSANLLMIAMTHTTGSAILKMAKKKALANTDALLHKKEDS